MGDVVVFCKSWVRCGSFMFTISKVDAPVNRQGNSLLTRWVPEKFGVGVRSFGCWDCWGGSRLGGLGGLGGLRRETAGTATVGDTAMRTRTESAKPTSDCIARNAVITLEWVNRFPILTGPNFSHGSPGSQRDLDVPRPGGGSQVSNEYQGHGGSPNSYNRPRSRWPAGLATPRINFLDRLTVRPGSGFDRVTISFGSTFDPPADSPSTGGKIFLPHPTDRWGSRCQSP